MVSMHVPFRYDPEEISAFFHTNSFDKCVCLCVCARVSYWVFAPEAKSCELEYSRSGCLCRTMEKKWSQISSGEKGKCDGL